jgi:hypothetical protein
VSSIEIPGTLREALEDDLVDAITEALAPPEEDRSEALLEVEIESEEEGTFCLTIEDGFATGEAKFADDPFVSCFVPEGGFPLVQKMLQAWVDGFPNSPELRGFHERGKTLKADVVDAGIEGLSGIKDLVVVAEVAGVGTFKAARGAIDEATRELVLKVDGSVIDKAIAGDMGPARGVKPKKGATLVTELVTALGPVIKALKARQ